MGCFSWGLQGSYQGHQQTALSNQCSTLSCPRTSLRRLNKMPFLLSDTPFLRCQATLSSFHLQPPPSNLALCPSAHLCSPPSKGHADHHCRLRALICALTSCFHGSPSPQPKQPILYAHRYAQSPLAADIPNLIVQSSWQCQPAPPPQVCQKVPPCEFFLS